MNATELREKLNAERDAITEEKNIAYRRIEEIIAREQQINRITGYIYETTRTDGHARDPYDSEIREFGFDTTGKKCFWSFWDYDVWGNEEDGFTVNDRNEVAEILLPVSPTCQDIVNELKAIGWVNSGDDIRIGIDEGTSDDTRINLILDENEMPIGELIREEL
jgi:hypothetical protein